ncbi:hypothetical protein [Methanobrevibacter sp.]|uniref:hypothetical protein n=1 Tax=Methanobrevibacter sp. TaxID=66852 RepID=UPI0025D35623|nr:hypothetical protein [Methanobrevibacter sp.]MBQ2666786.1 hypothetical protein [Methanobrevibacter sp.]
MIRSPLRLITVISLFLIVLILEFFTDINQNVIFSIALITLFLILFTFIFKTPGHSLLNIFVIFFSFICLPLFVLWYLDVFNSLLWPWGSISLAIVVVILGILSIVTMVKLNYVELRFD